MDSGLRSPVSGLGLDLGATPGRRLRQMQIIASACCGKMKLFLLEREKERESKATSK